MIGLQRRTDYGKYQCITCLGKIKCNYKKGDFLSDVYARWVKKLEGMGRPAGGGLGGWAFGDVLEAGRGKLRVVCGGLTLEAEELRVPAGLDYSWTEDDGRESYLRAGDRLLMLVTGDRQDYYILQKSPWG